MHSLGNNVHRIRKVNCFSCFLKMSKKPLILAAIVSLFDTFLAVDYSVYSLIDKNHLEKFPFCGKLSKLDVWEMSVLQRFQAWRNWPHIPPKATSGRIVNSKTAVENYRWVVRIVTRNLRTDGVFIASRCSGSIITER